MIHMSMMIHNQLSLVSKRKRVGISYAHASIVRNNHSVMDHTFMSLKGMRRKPQIQRQYKQHLQRQHHQLLQLQHWIIYVLLSAAALIRLFRQPISHVELSVADSKEVSCYCSLDDTRRCCKFQPFAWIDLVTVAPGFSIFAFSSIFAWILYYSLIDSCSYIFHQFAWLKIVLHFVYFLPCVVFGCLDG